MKNIRNKTIGSFPILDHCKKFDEVGFGCDYLTLNFYEYIEKFHYYLYLVDTDNSNFGVYECFECYKLTYNRIPTPLGESLHFTIEYNGISFPVFTYCEFNASTKKLTGYTAQLKFYGSFYRLIDCEFFPKKFEKKLIHSLTSEDPSISRYDFRIDFMSKYNEIEVPSIDSCMELHSKSFSQEWRSGGILTNWQVGISSTGRYQIRYYDKKLDTTRKNKRALYYDYISYASVHRLEYELGRSFCRGFTLSQLDKLESKIYTMLNLEKTFYGVCFYKYDSSKEITDYNYGTHLLRFENSVNKFAKAGYNPFVLIFGSLVRKFGKEFAEDLLDDFIYEHIKDESFC